MSNSDKPTNSSRPSAIRDYAYSQEELIARNWTAAVIQKYNATTLDKSKVQEIEKGVDWLTFRRTDLQRQMEGIRAIALAGEIKEMEQQLAKMIAQSKNGGDK